MPKYQILFDRNIVMTCALEIEATDKTEAREKAWGIVKRNLKAIVLSNDPEIEWLETEHNSVKSIDLVNCEEV